MIRMIRTLFCTYSSLYSLFSMYYVKCVCVNLEFHCFKLFSHKGAHFNHVNPSIDDHGPLSNINDSLFKVICVTCRVNVDRQYSARLCMKAPPYQALLTFFYCMQQTETVLTVRTETNSFEIHGETK